MQQAEKNLQQELIARVSALDGKQLEVDTNRLTLRATVDALSECTNVDRDTINRIADQLSVLPENLSNEDNNLTETHNRYAKIICIAIFVLFCFSMFRWFNVSGNINSVLHNTSTLQSHISDFQLRTGRYPYSLDQIPHNADIPDSVKSMEIGPRGQLLIETKGLFGAELIITPPLIGYRSRWSCTTNASLIFVITKWVCSYGSTQFKA